MCEITDKIISAFQKNSIAITQEQAQKLKIYLEFLLEYNDKVNLTAVTEVDEVIEKHFVDSAIGVSLIKENAVCADIGTGAGFPGVPLAVLRPDITVALVDALNKRLVFLNELKEKIGIDNLYTVHGRSEDLAKDKNMREHFDYVFSRAVARMNILAEYDLPFVKKGGEMLAWKGPQLNEELDEAQKAVKILGGEVKKVFTSGVEGTEHYIAIIKKIKETPPKYPRQASIPKKKPL
ncbi:MAG: 16S rRNA (guanine(527)-N(7))-methyltransferase RsmG [Clostridia bacterium]|nr:16S rRNA (guanine(527)-N(7))-methyltransferase RsmG [Clostridia bacterium]